MEQRFHLSPEPLVGMIVDWHTETGAGLYRIKYTDGDVEDLPYEVAVNSLLTLPPPRPPRTRIVSAKRPLGTSVHELPNCHPAEMRGRAGVSLVIGRDDTPGRLETRVNSCDGLGEGYLCHSCGGHFPSPQSLGGHAKWCKAPNLAAVSPGRPHELESLESDDMEDEASTDRVATSSTESTEEIHKPSLPGLHATAAR